MALAVRLAPSLPLRLPPHFPQDGACRLGGQEGVIVWWVVIGRAEQKNGGAGGGGERFGAGVGRGGVGRGGGAEEGVHLSRRLFVVSLGVRVVVLLRFLHSDRGCGVGSSVPAAGVVHRRGDPVLQKEAHQAEGGAGSLGGVPQIGGGLGQGEGEGEAARGAAGGVGGGGRGGGGGGSDRVNTALTGGHGWAGGGVRRRGKKEMT